MSGGNTRRKIDGALKARVALAAIKEDKTTAQISSTFGVHASRVGVWKKQAIEGLPRVFGRNDLEEGSSDSRLVTSLYEEIGRLKMEVDYLKKRL